MRVPTKSYRVWHAPRVGSTLLCQMLSDTGIAGRPGEHLTLHGESSLCERYGVDNYESLRSAVWSLGTDKNGIFAAKVSAHAASHDKIVQEICGLKNIDVPDSYEDIWSDFFPNCKHIIILRRNKLRQIASWWKAIKDNQWHLINDETSKETDEFYQDKYDLDAFTHLYHEAVLRDMANGEYLQMNNLSSKTIVYEDLVTEPKRILNEVLTYLDLSELEVELPSIKYKITSSKINEEWVEKYSKHLQSNWSDKVWNH